MLNNTYVERPWVGQGPSADGTIIMRKKNETDGAVPLCLVVFGAVIHGSAQKMGAVAGKFTRRAHP
ncbi:hypothetical protein PhaeoP97_02060 [Phaeobacter porticola]|uniref:Uncharacterized protein n=1 Tax=Phaeobacter porticola TaxID=1844006 RepID=A0A1L3I5T0_9RHOB|nr:hypothetical protein PhaeoP97_02060 [Phaeobacter porticola]